MFNERLFDGDMITNCSTIIDSIKKHSTYRKECLNLMASENIMSPMAAEVLSSDLANRYTVGRPYNRWFPGFRYYDKVEELVEKIAKKLFHVNYVNVQAPTGMVANMAAYATLLKPRDLVLSLGVKHSGHYSHVAENMLSLFQARVEPLPFDEEKYTIDVEKAMKLIKKTQPKVIILGTSEFLFPAPIKELRGVCDETQTKILYDASHVSGLVAGQAFQNPMEEGADLLTMSTNKTLAAPSHGIVACKDMEIYQVKIERAMVPLLTSNHHAHHVAALAVTLAEFEAFGHAYAKQVIANAKALARALYAEGTIVLCPEKDCTESHTVLFDSVYPASEAVQLLAEANIISNAFQLPWNTEDFQTGIRIGTNELTRLGMKENEMECIAKLMADVILKRKSPIKVKKNVIELRSCFQKVHYCFEASISLSGVPVVSGT